MGTHAAPWALHSASVVTDRCPQHVPELPLQNKHYPRAWWIPGRLRVQLKNADGTPVNPEIPNSELHHSFLWELLPSLAPPDAWPAYQPRGISQ